MIGLRTFLIAALIAMAHPALAQRACDRWSFGTFSVAQQQPQEIVSGVPGQRVYICGYVLVANGFPPNVQFLMGQTTTDGPCFVSRAPMTPLFHLTQNQTVINRNAFPGETTPQGHAVCINSTESGSGQGSMDVILYWAQF